MKLHYTTKTFIIFIYYINVLYIKASPPKCETTVVDDQHRIVQTTEDDQHRIVQTTDWDGNIYNFQSISTSRVCFVVCRGKGG